eukprot:symbB.v1.2.018548.t1/scaffold1479.1/size116273/7
MLFADGTLYRGNFEKNRRHGHGHYRNSDGTPIFTGPWKNDEPGTGNADILYPSGHRYKGQVCDGCRDGKGSLWLENPDGALFLYTGQWEADEMHGRGELHGSDGVYRGQFLNGVREGKGRFEYLKEPHSYYEGSWEEDQPHGIGTFVNEQGEYDREFHEGELVPAAHGRFVRRSRSLFKVKVGPSSKPDVRVEAGPHRDLPHAGTVCQNAGLLPPEEPQQTRPIDHGNGFANARSRPAHRPSDSIDVISKYRLLRSPIPNLTGWIWRTDEIVYDLCSARCACCLLKDHQRTAGIIIASILLCVSCCCLAVCGICAYFCVTGIPKRFHKPIEETLEDWQNKGYLPRLNDIEGEEKLPDLEDLEQEVQKKVENLQDPPSVAPPGTNAPWRRSLRNTFRALSDWGDEIEKRHFDGDFGASARQAVEQHRSLISQASRIGGELSSAAVKLVEEATGRSDGADAGGAAEPLESYFCAEPEARRSEVSVIEGPSEGSDLWEEVSTIQAELQQHFELRRGRSAALNSQDEKLRSLRTELMASRLEVQEGLEQRHAAAARLEAAERGLEALQDAHCELKQLRQEHNVELRKLQVAANQALQAERAAAAAVDNGSWARDGPEIDALKAAKVELAELLAEADEVRLRSRRESAQLAHQLEGAQAEHARLGGKMTQEDVRVASPGQPRTVWRRLANARSEESNPFA